MQCGPPGPAQKEVTSDIPPGSAYILTGVAQGRTGFCEQRKVAHNMCTCCWTHGIWNEASCHTRESVTMRVFDTEWGRDVILNAVAVVVEGEEGDEDAAAAEATTEGAERTTEGGPSALEGVSHAEDVEPALTSSSPAQEDEGAVALEGEGSAIE